MNNIEVIKIDDNFKSYFFVKRDCFTNVMAYLNSTLSHKICAIYGLWRTGKSVLMYQCIENLSSEQKEQTILISHEFRQVNF